MKSPRERYVVISPFDDPKTSGYTIEDLQERRRLAVIWQGGPGDVSPARVAVRLARWLNRLAAIERENEQAKREEEGQ